MSVPPPFPPDSYYTCYYCEENIYHLADAFLKQPSITDIWDVFVVFISNECKAVALWNQKLAGSADKAIIWDYHVVLVLARSEPVVPSDTQDRAAQTWIYDFDTFLPKPCHWRGKSLV